MTSRAAARTASTRLAILARDHDRRLWLQRSFGGDTPIAAVDGTEEGYSEAFARLSLRPVGNTGSGLGGRAFFAAHVQAILAEEVDPSVFAIGFLKVRGTAGVAPSALKAIAHSIRSELQPEDHLAEVREAVFGVIAPAATAALLEGRLDKAALAVAGATYFDPALGQSVDYEVDLAMGRLDGKRSVETVFAEARRLRTHQRLVLATRDGARL